MRPLDWKRVPQARSGGCKSSVAITAECSRQVGTRRQPGKTVDQTTGTVPAMKPEATAVGITARWPLKNNLNVWWAQVMRTET